MKFDAKKGINNSVATFAAAQEGYFIKILSKKKF